MSAQSTAARTAEVTPLHVARHEPVVVKDTTANPAPLGLMGFGLTTVLLNLHNAGFFGLGSMILAMGLFSGGLGQVIVGVMEWKKNNTFGTVAFTSYGLFWLTLVGLVVMPKLGLAERTEPHAMAAYLILWGLFTTILFFGTLRLSRALQVVFASLAALFFLLAAGDLAHSAAITRFAGFEGIFVGAAAMYTGAAQVLNELFRREVLPLGGVQH